MEMTARKQIKKTLQEQAKKKTSAHKAKIVEARKQPTVLRLEKPTKPSRAKQLGYKSKQGFVVARVRVKRGSGMHTRPDMGRRPKRMGVNKLTRAKSKQVIAEERAQKRFPNMQVLNSYWAFQDGVYKWYEVIMVDPSHPTVKNDSNVNWACSPKNTRRVNRGKTSAGRKSSGKRGR
jgi:large subunit ribosomal protein L15e